MNSPSAASEDTPAPLYPMKKRLSGVFGWIIAIILVLMFVPALVKVATVDGNQVGVLENWWKGVDPNPYPARTYFLFPGFSNRMFTYPLSVQIFVMNDRPTKEGEYGEGRERDAYLVQSSEGQDMYVSLSVQWRIDPAKVIDIHTTIRQDIEERMLRPIVMRVVKDQATKRTAIEAYSGKGLVELQNAIFNELTKSDGELRKRGVIVENFVIEGIRLDPKYIGEITERQVAVQRRLKADEQTKAAQAEALRAEAEAQADLKRRVVEAERDKQMGILMAEKEAQQRILAAEAAKRQVVLNAEAEQQKLVLEATGTRDARLLEAEGLLAVGKAEAEAQKLRLSAYAVEGADAFVKIEVAKALAAAHQQVRGYLPADMNIYTLGNNFIEAIDAVLGRSPSAASLDAPLPPVSATSPSPTP